MRLAARCVLLALALAIPQATPGPAPDQVLTVRFTARDQQLRRYAYVPFTVPAGTTSLTISYSYARADGQNVIDLGVYEPGPLTLNSPALRGWTGGSYDRVTIGAAEASPGYWPGPLPSGQWQVMLGLYKIAAAGVDVQVRIEYFDAPASAKTAALPPRRPPTGRAGPAWYAGVLHAHTTHSDGALTPDALADKAHEEGLDFLAITDHNNTAHQRDLTGRDDLLIITGEEVTTPGGHFNVWGVGGWRDYLDFRLFPGDAALRSIMNQAHRRGAVIGINHPFSDCLACTWTHDVPAEVDTLEVANGSPAERLQSIAMWDTLLRAGHRLTAVGESDWHRGATALGTPALRVWAQDLTTPSILAALRHGRAVVTASAALPPPEFVVETAGRRARIGDTLDVRQGETLRMTVNADRRSYPDADVALIWNGEAIEHAPLAVDGVAFARIAAMSGYARLQITAPDQRLLAITNPIFVTVR